MRDERRIEDVVRQEDGGIALEGSMTSPLGTGTEELIAIGAALAANCDSCLCYHVRRGAEVGCTREAMCRAVEIAQGVKDTPAHLLANLADRLLGSSLGPRRGDSSSEAAGVPTAATSSGHCCSPPAS